MVQSRPIIDQVKDTQQPYSHVSFADLPVDKLPFRVEWRGTIYNPEDKSIPLDLAHALNYLNAAQEQQYQNELAPSNSQFQAIADNTGLTSGHGVLCRLSDETTWTFEPYTFEAIANSAGLKKAAGSLYRNPDGTWVFQAKSAPTLDEVAIATSLTPEEGAPYRQPDGSWVLRRYKRILTSGLTIYVSPIGDDSTADGTEALPFQTIPGALYWLDQNIDNGRFSVTIKLAPGTYDSLVLIPSDLKNLTILGDTNNPFDYVLSSSNLLNYIVRVDGNAQIRLSGISLSALTGSALALLAQNNSIVNCDNCAIQGDYSNTTINCVDPGSKFVLTGNFFLSGKHNNLFSAVYGGRIALNMNCQFQGAVTATNFLIATRHAHIVTYATATFSGTVSGRSAYAVYNGIIEGKKNLPAALSAETKSNGGIVV